MFETIGFMFNILKGIAIDWWWSCAAVWRAMIIAIFGDPLSRSELSNDFIVIAKYSLILFLN